jgi:hypothetical protein
LGETLPALDGDPAFDRDPISEGYSPKEIAHELVASPRWISDRLDELRDEIERL